MIIFAFHAGVPDRWTDEVQVGVQVQDRVLWAGDGDGAAAGLRLRGVGTRQGNQALRAHTTHTSG